MCMNITVGMTLYSQLINYCFFVSQDFAIEVIKSTHNFWKALISQQAKAGELNWYTLHLSCLM